MGANIKDIYIEQGVSFDLSLTITDGVGVPFDMDFYTIDFVVEVDVSQYTGTITEYINGVARLSFVSGETQVMQHGVGSYIVNLTSDVTGDVTRLVKGRAYIDKGIS